MSIRFCSILAALMWVSTSAYSCPNPESSLADACPELLRALDAQGFVAELGINTTHKADAQTVMRLQSLLDVQTPVGIRPPIDDRNLTLIRNQHYEAMAHQAPGMWQQFLAWWASIFESDKESDFDASYWSQFAPSVLLAKILFFAISTLLLLMSGYFLWRELKPVWQAKRANRRLSGSLQVALQQWPPSVDTSNPARALSQFFAAIVQRLSAINLLPKNPSLTHRELSAQLNPAQVPTIAATFDELSAQAQSALFANQPVSAEALQAFAEKSQMIVEHTKQLKGNPHA
jgi:hypothetical protein